MRRVSVQTCYEIEDECASLELMLFARSFICTGEEIISPVYSILRLVRALDVMGMVFEAFPGEILQLVNLHYLAFSCTSGVPIGISRLWNLQTLICGQPITLNLPSEIWEISELKTSQNRLKNRMKMVEDFVEIWSELFHTIKLFTLAEDKSSKSQLTRLLK
ncbi:hypothetical protein SASPL_154274 [Salvia splendens]|uniref:Uncharacterized protein n=1 Tax=Salvia splendens TaxID=180675 RepID=A0A8X8YZ51_SALSN|nr:hypothetical protein SASPL_154274 [Salvia splendens]